MKVAAHQLQSWVESLFVALDVLPEHARTTSRRLVEADLRGRSGHGVIRVPPYAKRIEAGGINLRPELRLRRETPVSAVADGDNGLGQVVMTFAVDTAVRKAKESGMAWVGTVRSNHAGAAGVYTALAVDQGLIAIYTAVGSANVMPPWGGSQRILGTNPIAIAIPAGDELDFQLDIATTVASHGTIKVAAEAGESMPEGWVIGLDGKPITDPKRADEGFLVPIGEYKGSGLNIAIGLLAGVLNGAAFGREVIDHRTDLAAEANTGQSIFVMRPDLMRDTGDFESAMDHHLRELRAGSENVRLPGDGAASQVSSRSREGIPLSESLVSQLQELGARYGLEDLVEE